MNVEISSIAIAGAFKRRRGVQIATYRIIRDCIETKCTPVEGSPHCIGMDIAVKSRQFEAVLKGTLNKETGDLAISIVEETPSSYLKKKRFRVVGYTPEVGFTNAHHRS